MSIWTLLFVAIFAFATVLDTLLGFVSGLAGEEPDAR